MILSKLRTGSLARGQVVAAAALVLLWRVAAFVFWRQPFPEFVDFTTIGDF